MNPLKTNVLKILVKGYVGGRITGEVASAIILYRREVEKMYKYLKSQKAILEARLKIAEKREAEGKNTLLV